MEWRNQVAVVTGGARGLGRATARLKRGRRDPYHARSDGDHAGATLGRIVNMASIAAIGRAVWQCILRGNEGRGGVSHAALCPGPGTARHHRECRGARLRSRWDDAARPAAAV